MYRLTPNRQAFLAVINACEGFPHYDQLFAYKPFNNAGPHPNISQKFSGGSTTAAGAYQFLYKTWQQAISALGLSDWMSAQNQDQAALYLIDANANALGDVDKGNIETAITKCNTIWASLPGSPYGQPTHDMSYVMAQWNKQIIKKK